MQDFTSGCDALISLQMSALFLSKSKRRSQVNISQLSVYSSESGLLLAENIRIIKIVEIAKSVSVGGDGEFHSNFGLRFDGLSRLVIRLEAPLFDGFTRRSKQCLRTTGHFCRLRFSTAATRASTLEWDPVVAAA